MSWAFLSHEECEGVDCHVSDTSGNVISLSKFIVNHRHFIVNFQEYVVMIRETDIFVVLYYSVSTICMVIWLRLCNIGWVLRYS